MAALLALAAAAASMAPCAAAAASGATIDITKFAFHPAEITVEPGTTVTWVNHDRFEHTFDQGGDYAYYCTLHPFMTGVVHVRKP